MPDYEFETIYDPGEPNAYLIRVTAQLRDSELEHWRTLLEAAYKRGWQDLYFRLPLVGFPYPSPDDGPYSKENFAKTLAEKR